MVHFLIPKYQHHTNNMNIHFVSSLNHSVSSTILIIILHTCGRCNIFNLIPKSFNISKLFVSFFCCVFNIDLRFVWFCKTNVRIEGKFDCEMDIHMYFIKKCSSSVDEERLLSQSYVLIWISILKINMFLGSKSISRIILMGCLMVCKFQNYVFSFLYIFGYM